MEREFLRTAFMEQIQKNFLFPVIDTLELEADFLRNKQSFIAGLLHKQLPSLRLAQVRERYNLPAYESHNALVDALATAELLQAQIAKHQLGTIPVRSLWY
jgi:DNA polymerase-3 subunit epsilon